jgi:hypothetical protein
MGEQEVQTEEATLDESTLEVAVDGEVSELPKVERIIRAAGTVGSIATGIIGDAARMQRYMAATRGNIKPSGNHPSPGFTDCSDETAITSHLL